LYTVPENFGMDGKRGAGALSPRRVRPLCCVCDIAVYTYGCRPLIAHSSLDRLLLFLHFVSQFRIGSEVAHGHLALVLEPGSDHIVTPKQAFVTVARDFRSVIQFAILDNL